MPAVDLIEFATAALYTGEPQPIRAHYAASPPHPLPESIKHFYNQHDEALTMLRLGIVCKIFTFLHINLRLQKHLSVVSLKQPKAIDLIFLAGWINFRSL